MLNCATTSRVMILLGLFGPAAEAETWQTRLPVFVAAGNYVQSTRESTTSFSTVSAFAELRFESDRKCWSAGVFADYRKSLDADAAAILKTGMLVRHRNGDWDTLGALFRGKPRGVPGAWGYFGRVRYRLGDRHKIGVESFGLEGQLDNAYLMLGYYADVSQDISLRLVGGASVGSDHDREARVEIVWQVN